MEKRSILIVDDELLIRQTLADFLGEHGYQVATAADGVEGLSMARSNQFDVALADLRMPGLDGLDLVDTLKTEQPQLPVVIISGTGSLIDVIEAMRRGAWDYVTKPIQDMNEVLVVIERVLAKLDLIVERDQYQQRLEQLNRSLEAEVARQTRDLRVQNRELAALNRVAYAISEPLEMEAMLQRAVDAAIAAVESDGGAVRLLDHKVSQLPIIASHGLAQSYLQSAATIQLGQGVIGSVALTGRPRTGSDLAEDPYLVHLSPRPSQKHEELDGFAGFRSYLCVSLRSGDKMVGTLEVYTQEEHDFGAREVELLATIGNQIRVAVDRAQHAASLKQAISDLERANAELRRLDTLRDQFIQNVSHELRTPLTLAHGYIEMLVQGGLSSEERQMALDVTSRRVQALVQLVESITTMQDLDSRPLRIEPVVPSELMETALRMTGQRASATNVQVQVDCPPDLPAFRGDFTRLAQALYQLLDNAYKFSPENSTIRFTAQLSPSRDALTISVSDRGIGIPAEQQAHIFDRFYQVDGSASRRYGGTGLGLALAWEIVSAHGGKIQVQSDGLPGQGSTFSVILPLFKP